MLISKHYNPINAIGLFDSAPLDILHMKYFVCSITTV